MNNVIYRSHVVAELYNMLEYCCSEVIGILVVITVDDDLVTLGIVENDDPVKFVIVVENGATMLVIIVVLTLFDFEEVSNDIEVC